MNCSGLWLLCYLGEIMMIVALLVLLQDLRLIDLMRRNESVAFTLTGVVGLYGTDFPTQGVSGHVPIWVNGGTRRPRLCFLPLLSLRA